MQKYTQYIMLHSEALYSPS